MLTIMLLVSYNKLFLAKLKINEQINVQVIVIQILTVSSLISYRMLRIQNDTKHKPKQN